MMELLTIWSHPGRLEWIGLRPAHRQDLIEVNEAMLIAGSGIIGDHSVKNTSNGTRQVTLIQAEHLPVIAALCGLEQIHPAQLRRNLVISGINIATLKDQRFTLGEAELEGTGYCHPCSRMEQELGRGGYNAVRGHGGITARVIRGGRIAAGDPLMISEHRLEP